MCCTYRRRSSLLVCAGGNPNTLRPGFFSMSAPERRRETDGASIRHPHPFRLSHPTSPGPPCPARTLPFVKAVENLGQSPRLALNAFRLHASLPFSNLLRPTFGYHLRYVGWSPLLIAVRAPLHSPVVLPGSFNDSERLCMYTCVPQGHRSLDVESDLLLNQRGYSQCVRQTEGLVRPTVD